MCNILLGLAPLVIANVYAQWDSEFIQTSKTLPSIEVRLSPPEHPLPQVQQEIDKLEKHRIWLEQAMMAKLEDAFNETLVNSRDRINDIINKSLSIFNQGDLLRNMAEASQLRKRKISQVTFLQLEQKIVPSSVRVMMAETQTPDPIIKEKMDQIEQMRNDEEIQTFHQQSQELEQLTQVTLLELQKALQLELDPYLVDTEKLRKRTFGNHPQATSFLQLGSFVAPNAQQLNVKIGQSDIPYPTIDDLVMNMEKRRDTAEHAQRNTVLQMYLKLIKAQHEMIREQLHVGTARVLSEYAALEKQLERHTTVK